jgi:hypothetical protein
MPHHGEEAVIKYRQSRREVFIVNDNIFIGMVETLEDNFQELSSDIVSALRDTDETYAALFEKRLELQRRFPCIQATVERDGGVSMTAEEHAGLLEYLGVVNEMENIERLRLYYAGHRDCFAYLKKIGAI